MVIPIIIMSTMGFLFGLGLAFASKIFKMEIDPKIEGILSVLPGANCGACGKAGCAGLAEAIAKGDVSLTSCPVAEEQVYEKIADILGTDKTSAMKMKKSARVRCGGGQRANDKYVYQGVKTCGAAAMIAGGLKLCGFACIGFGDCAVSCPFDAIYMGKDNIPVVDPQKCTSCGKCVAACPKNIISLEYMSEKYYVKCLSRDKIVFVKNACKAGCIACRICEKLSKGAFVVEDNLSRLDYSKVNEAAPLDLCVEKCPTKCIVKRVSNSSKQGGRI